MAAIKSPWGRRLVKGLSYLFLLSLLIWLVAMALILSKAGDYISRIAAKPAPSLNDQVLVGYIELTDSVRQGTDGIAAPFSWVIGQTPCARVLAQVPDSSQNAATKGIDVGSRGLAALDVPGLRSLFVGCNANNAVDRVLLRFYKDRNELVRMQAMARELNPRYHSTQTYSPADQQQGGLFSAWRADNAVIQINYHSMDRNFWLEYVDPCTQIRLNLWMQRQGDETAKESQQIDDAADAAYAACLRARHSPEG